MKFKYLLPAAMLATALSSQAVPAYPGLIQRTLEDGSTVMVRLHGDEFFSYMTDADGFLLQQGADGRVAYKLDASNAKVLASQSVIDEMHTAVAETPVYKVMRANEKQRMAALDSRGRSTFCTEGDVHFLVLLVQYSDIKFNSPTIREDMDAMLNKEGYNLNGCPGSIRDYFMASSNGKFRPTFDVSPVITLPQTSSYYVGTNKYDNVAELVKNAVELADPDVDFSKYCNLQEGWVDAVIIWYAGYGQADTANKEYIWPHQSDLRYRNIKADGVQIGAYCMFNELNGGTHYYNKDGAMAGVGTPIHEFGHVMGLPDLYDPDYSVRSTPGRWDIMDQGPYLGDGYCPPSYSGYERWCLRWTDYEDVKQGTHYNLEDINKNGRALRIPVINTSGTEYLNEYFVLEHRERSGWDAYLPNDGMLLWHVDYNKAAWNNNTVNSNESRKRLHLITADGSANYKLGNTSSTTDKAAWPQEINYITPDTDITLNTNYVLADSETGNSFITNIAYDVQNKCTTFDYNMITESPTDVTVMAAPVRIQNEMGNPTNDFTFSWEPVEGADSYRLTVYRLSGGRTYYESGLNEKDMGTATSYTLESLARNKLDLTYYAYVRVVKGIPSLEKSNEVEFVPSQVELTGVEGVEIGNEAIRGLKGAILAPADAEIYNMQGMRCNATGLQPGIYMVRTAAGTVKVTVK